MAFKDIKGNEELIDRLRQIATSGEAHHAYIIEGPTNVNKDEIAFSFAQALLCKQAPGEGCGSCPTCRQIEAGSYADLFYAAPTAKGSGKVKSVRDEAIDSLIEKLMHKPLSGDRYIAIISGADTITPKATGHILKTLEEPPEGSVIMLLSENTDFLESTIRSRCIKLMAPAAGALPSEYTEDAIRLVELLAVTKRYRDIKEIVEKPGRDIEKVSRFLDCLEDAYREKLLNMSAGMKKENIFLAIKEIERVRKKLAGGTRGIRADFALKAMTISIMEGSK